MQLAGTYTCLKYGRSLPFHQRSFRHPCDWPGAAAAMNSAGDNLVTSKKLGTLATGRELLSVRNMVPGRIGPFPAKVVQAHACDWPGAAPAMILAGDRHSVNLRHALRRRCTSHHDRKKTNKQGGYDAKTVTLYVPRLDDQVELPLAKSHPHTGDRDNPPGH